MPEGDSVFRVARRLDAALRGQVLVRADLRVPRYATADLVGRRVLETVSRGKHLLTRLDDGLTLHTHLRMDGRWTVLRAGRRLPRRLDPDIRVLLATASVTAVGLQMPVVELVTDEAAVVGHLGPDLLGDDWDLAEAVRRTSAVPSRGLAAALLDQRNVAGLGNLWVNEVCFLRGHSPWTPVAEVDLVRTLDLAARMMRFSVEHPGAAMVTTGDTRRGQQHWVAGRAGRPCRRCATPVRVVAEVPGDAGRRRTWWCPRCQPGPPPPAAGPAPRTPPPPVRASIARDPAPGVVRASGLPARAPGQGSPGRGAQAGPPRRGPR